MFVYFFKHHTSDFFRTTASPSFFLVSSSSASFSSTMRSYWLWQWQVKLLHGLTFMLYKTIFWQNIHCNALTLCFSISATISAILCWHLSSASSLFLIASADDNLSFCICKRRWFYCLLLQDGKNLTNNFSTVITLLFMKPHSQALLPRLICAQDPSAVSVWLPH